MRATRPSPIGLNVPIRIFGFPPQMLTLTLVCFAIALITPINKLVTFIAAGVALLLIWLFARDPVKLLIFAKALFQKAKYEPTRREVFKLEIRK